MAAPAEDIPDFMDLDLVDIPDELLDVNDEFIDVYLKNVRDGGTALPCPALWRDLVCTVLGAPHALNEAREKVYYKEVRFLSIASGYCVQSIACHLTPITSHGTSEQV